MTLFRLDASIRDGGSHSRELADVVEREWRTANPSERIVRRHVGLQPIPATAWPNAVAAASVPEADRTPDQRAAVELARTEVDALLAGDAALFAVPLYNYGVPQHFKAWVDLVITDPRMASGAPSAVRGRPAVLVVVRGGSYAAGTPREGWDHATGWAKHILADTWGYDLTVVEKEFTLVGVNPALDEFTDVAEQMHRDAVRAAAEHGKRLAA